MAALGELYAELALKTDKFESGVTKSNRELAKLEQDIDKSTEAINAKLAKIGGALSLGVTAPLTILGKAAIDTFTSFEQSMQNTFSVMGASKAEMEALRAKAEEMGASTRFSASNAAGALFMLGQSGQSASQAMSSLDGVLRLAGATGTDMAFTSSTIASTLSQFNLEAGKASHIADVFATAMNKSQANMTKLSYSMKYVGPVASGLNVSLETATATLMQLYNTGFGGEQAGTILRAALQKLASGTDELKDKLKKYGLAYDDVNPKVNNLADIMDKLKGASIGVAEANDLFGEAAASGMSKLISNGGDAIRTMDGLLQSSDGAAKKMQDIQNTSFANTKAEFASAFEAVQITIISNVMPAIDAFVKALTHVLNFVNELPAGVQVAGTAMASFATMAGPLVLVAIGVKKIKSEMAQLNMVLSANPIFAIGTAVAAVGAIALGVIAQVKKNHEAFLTQATKGLDKIKEKQDEALQAGNKGRKLNSILDEYEALRNKTSRTADEQAKYNSLLKELQEIVPDTVTKVDEYGNALEVNSEKARKAARDFLNQEQLINNLAMVEAKAKSVNAKAVLAKYSKKDRDEAESIVKSKTDITNTIADMYMFVQTKVLEYENETNKKIKDSIAKDLVEAFNIKTPSALKEQLKGRFYNTLNIYDIEEGLKESLEIAKEDLKKSQTEFSEIATAITENEKALREIEKLQKRGEKISKGLGELESPKETKATTTQVAELKKLSDAWKEFSNNIENAKAKAKFEGKDFDVNEESFKFLKEKLKSLAEIPAEAIDKVFTEKTPELQSWVQLMWSFKKEKTPKSSLPDNKKLNIDNSYKGQLDALDAHYKALLDKADEYGENKYEIEKAWQAERLALVKSFIEKEQKEIQAGNKKISEEEAKAQAERTETKKEKDGEKGSGVTLGQELRKSALMDFISGQQERRRALERELEYVKAKIKELGELLSSGISLDDKTRADYYTFLQELKKRAKEIEIKLNPYSNVEGSLKELKSNSISPIKKQWDEVNKNVEKYKNAIKEAKENKVGDFKGLDDKKDAGKIAETEAKLNADVKSYEVNAKAGIASGILQGVLSILNPIADLIAEAIEQGGLDGISALQTTSGLLSQIGGMVPGVTGVVMQGLGGALGIATKILSAVREVRYKAAKEEADAFNKEQEELLQKRLKAIDKSIGGFLENLTKRIAGIGKGGLDWNKMLDIGGLQRQRRSIDNFLKDIENTKTSETYTTTRQEVKKTTSGAKTSTISETHNKELKQVLEEYYEALNAGNRAEATRLKTIIAETVQRAAKDKKINLDEIDGVSNYVKGLDTALANYIKTNDMKAFKTELKKSLYEAVIQKAVFNAALEKILATIDLLEQGKIGKEQLEKSLESVANDAKAHAKRIADALGIDMNIDDIESQWKELGKSLSSALSQALGESAYEADWAAFKKSFASEMKKAIVQSAIETAGIKEKVNAIIKAIMADGKITGNEVTDTIEKMKVLFDGLEDDMAEIAKITKALSGDGAIEMKANGTIIQNLSGADRDWFTEVFKDGFSKINQVIDLKETTIQHLAATQLIINTFTFNSYDGKVYITANENTDIKGLLTEIVREVVA